VSPTSLLRRRDLLRRVDTKFVAPLEQLGSIFHGLEAHYARLLANGASWASYETLYFDTKGDRFFHDHRRGRLGRHKVRIRHYIDREVTYFEVKLKSNRRITTKVRRPKDFRCSTLETEDLALGSEVPQVPLSEVVPRLWTLFSRLQLVGREHLERVTIDVGVGFRHGRIESAAALDELATSRAGGRRLVRELPADLRPLAVVEVKQPRYRSRTPIMLSLRREGVRRTRSSKYCTGVYLTNSTIRAHRFLPNFKKIARLQCSSC
jgi:hypothetical protein